MPLRGSLFRKLQQLKREREKHQAVKFKEENIQEAFALKKLRQTRVKEEGRAALRRAIAGEKARIKAAKGPRRKGVISQFLKREIGAGLKAAKKRRKQVRSKKKKKRKRKKRG